MKTINTAYGDVEIKDLTPDMLSELQERLPYGFYPFNQEFNGARYGFVVRCGAEEIPLLKQQPVECPQDWAYKMIEVHTVLILVSYCKMIEDNIDGIYYATPYLKDKGQAGLESGIAHFIFPGNEKLSNNGLPNAYDDVFGNNATALFGLFMAYFNENFDDKFRLQYIGIDLRTRSQIGSLVSGFMLFKDSIIYLGTLHEGDPRFGVLAKNGVKSIIHAPSSPMEITPDQLAEAKGTHRQ